MRRMATEGPSLGVTTGCGFFMSEAAVITLVRSTFSTNLATYSSAGSVRISSGVPI